MRVRWQWIIGLIGLALAVPATSQNAGETPTVAEAETNATDVSTKPPLTGNPRLDYIHDPNLPHELKNYDLSNYPFYNGLPKDLLTSNFTCDDRLDGFYASVPHRCQVYHNCLFGQRYDFLCANFTVFDQKNFICHYVSEVDCPNSADHYDRNEELYVTTTTTTPAPQIIYVNRPSNRPARPLGGPGRIRPNRPNPFKGNRRPGNRRTTTTTPAPAYYDDYYYDDYYNNYYDNYYDDYTNDKTTTTTTTTTPRPRQHNRPHRKRLGGEGGRTRPAERGGNAFNAKDRKRPRINPPGPLDDELAGPRASRLRQSSPSRQQAINEAPVDEPPRRGQDGPSGPRRTRPGVRKPRPRTQSPNKPTTTTTSTTTTEVVPEKDYYDYYYDDEPSTTAAPARSSFSRTRPGGSQRRSQNRPSPTTTTTTTEAPTTEAPRDPVTRPSRGNVRRNPVSSRRTPINGALPLDKPQETVPTQETAASERPRPQRLRPQFPRNRGQGESSPSRQDTVITEEDPPLAVEPDLTLDAVPVDTAENLEVRTSSQTSPAVSRAPIRRLGQSGSGRQRPGQRERVQQRPPNPDYYDY